MLNLSKEKQITWDELKEFLGRNSKLIIDKDAKRKFEKWFDLLEYIDEGDNSIKVII